MKEYKHIRQHLVHILIEDVWMRSNERIKIRADAVVEFLLLQFETKHLGIAEMLVQLEEAYVRVLKHSGKYALLAPATEDGDLCANMNKLLGEKLGLLLQELVIELTRPYGF